MRHRGHGRLNRLRRAEGLTRDALARALGVSEDVVGRWEDGDPIPSGHAVALARRFGVSVAWLTGAERLPSEALRLPPRRARRFAAAERAPRIARLRMAEGLSAAALAQLAGVPESEVERWESAAATPDERTQRLLAARFGVTVEFLMGRERLDVEVRPLDGAGPQPG